MKKNTIAKNFVMNILLTMSSIIFPLITFPYVSRVLLPAGTGKVSFAVSFVSYFNQIAQLGIPTYGIRACAQVRDNKEELSKVVHELLLINLIMSIIAYISLGVSLITVPKLWEDRGLYLIVSSAVFLNAIGMEWLYKGIEEYTYITVRSLLFKLAALLAMFLLVHTEQDYVKYGAVTILAASCSNIFNFINAHRHISMKIIGKYHLKRHFKPVIVFFAMSCAVTIYTNLDTVMLGFMTSDIDVGYYNAAIKIKTILVNIVTSLGTVLLPRASYYIENNKIEEFKKIGYKSIQFVVLISLPMIIYFILFAKEGIIFLSGHEYYGAVLPMQIIMPTLLFIGLSNVIGLQMLVPLGKEKIMMYAEISGAVVDLSINFLLIPHYGAAGAAIGTLIAEIAVFSILAVNLRVFSAQAFAHIHWKRLILSAAAAVIFSAWIKLFDCGEFFSLIISSVLFFGMYLGCLLVMKEDFVIEILEKVLHKIRNKSF